MNIHEWIIKNLPKNSTIIEAGSCEGLDTLFFSNNFSEGSIFSFEPIKDLYEQTKGRVAGKTNVKLYNLALSNVSEKKLMHLSDRFGQIWGSSSFLTPKDHLITNPEITFNSKTEVESISLETFISNNNIEKIDLMWLDMQGYEPIVLMNSPNALKITKYIYTEVSTMENYQGMILYPEYKTFLESSGYEVIYEGLEWVDGGNVLFGNKKIVS